MHNSVLFQVYAVKRLKSEATGQCISTVKGMCGMLELIWNQTWPLFVQPYAAITWKLCYLMFVLYAIGHGALMWFPDFLSQMQVAVGTDRTLCNIVAEAGAVVQNATEM